MKHLLTILTLALSTGACWGSGLPVGLGIADVHVDTGTVVELFDDLDAAEPTLRFLLVEDGRINALAFASPLPAWLRTEGIWLDYHIIVFRVVRESDSCLEVIVDEDGQTLWLRRSPAINYQPWPEFLMTSVTAFSQLDAAANPLRRSASDTAAVVPYDGNPRWSCFAAEEVVGQWVRVRTSVMCDYEGGVKIPDAWLRWRDEEQLLIEYGMTC